MDDDRGSAAAELAVALPAVAVVLALALGALQLGAMQVRVQDAASADSRAAARGDAGGTAARIAGAVSSREDFGDLVCVRVTAPAGRGPFAAVRLTARGCALGGGR